MWYPMNAYYRKWLADETERKRMAAKWTGPSA